MTWPIVRDKYLAAKAVGLRIRTSLDYKKVTPSAIAAAVLKRALDLPLEPMATLAVARDAVCWKVIGVNSAKKFAGKDAFPFMAAMLPMVDEALKGRVTERLLVAQISGARNPTPGAVAEALVKNLVFGPSDVGGPSSPARTQPGAHTLPLGEFAARVQEVTDTAPTGTFGLDKVFISHVWRHFVERGYSGGMTESEFKDRLLAAHRGRLITLAGEDFPDRRDSGDINKSAISYLNATYHYVRAHRG